MTTRVPPVVPGTRAELSAIESSIKAQRGDSSLLYQVLLNSAPLADGWEKMLSAVRNRSSVPADIREMLILRVAILNRAPFEFKVHALVARKVGVTNAKLAALHDAKPAGRSLRSSAPCLRLPMR